MKPQKSRRKLAPVPTLSPAASCRKGEGMGEKCKTTTQELPGKKPNWRCGAPGGNRNAAKAVTPLSTIRTRTRSLKRRFKAVLRQIGKAEEC
jgi:hypothetical protein